MAVRIVMLMIGLIAGLAAGVYGGMRMGSAAILDVALTKDARQAQQAIVTLQRLRAGERDVALEQLETRLDDTLIPFDPAAPYPGLDQRTVTEINHALREAKAYRATNPRKSSRPQVDAMVGNLLARGTYKQ